MAFKRNIWRRAGVGLSVTCCFVLSACALQDSRLQDEFARDNGLLQQQQLATHQWLQQMRREQVLYEDGQARAVVQHVLNQLLPAADAHGISVEFSRLPGENALALPDGTIIINQSLLSALSSEEQIAFLLAHELAHQLLGHAWQLMGKRQSLAQGSGAKISALALSDRTLVHQRAFGRSQETQADAYAAQLLSQAGYDLHLAAKFFTQLQKYPLALNSNQVMRTHPSLAQRHSALLQMSAGLEGRFSDSRSDRQGRGGDSVSPLSAPRRIPPAQFQQFRMTQLQRSVDRKIEHGDLAGAMVQVSELEELSSNLAAKRCLRARVYAAIASDVAAASAAFSEIFGNGDTAGNSVHGARTLSASLAVNQNATRDSEGGPTGLAAVPTTVSRQLAPGSIAARRFFVKMARAGFSRQLKDDPANTCARAGLIALENQR